MELAIHPSDQVATASPNVQICASLQLFGDTSPIRKMYIARPWIDMIVLPNLTLPLIAFSTIVLYRCLFDSLLKVEAGITNQLLRQCTGAFPNCWRNVSAPIILVLYIHEHHAAWVKVYCTLVMTKKNMWAGLSLMLVLFQYQLLPLRSMLISFRC